MFLFRDKGWTRKPGWGARAYAFLAPNYRMTELQGAVGLAQVKKVRGVVEKRMELGNYLTELIDGIEGVTPPPITEGSEHGYWLYPLRIDGWPIASFAEALTEEGVAAGAAYIGEPIFLCMDALAAKNTFGNSTHPFDGCHGGREIEYTRGMCPRTEEALQHMVTIGLNCNYTIKDIEDIAGAIRKVAELLPRG
jgi:dTDP-4-amino-4,6-dideoxygalactose transaminase